MGFRLGMPSVSWGEPQSRATLPLAAYQAAPLLDFPLRRGMELAPGNQKRKAQRKCKRLVQTSQTQRFCNNRGEKQELEIQEGEWSSHQEERMKSKTMES
jgi:hypothetical protein